MRKVQILLRNLLVVVLCLFGCILFSNTAEAKTIDEDSMYGVWEGSYAGTYEGKTIERKIRIDISQSSELGYFYGVANIDNGTSGTYSFNGEIDFTTGEVSFEGTDWMNNPSGFGFARFEGTLNGSLDRYSGLIDGNSSKRFVLKKTSKKPKKYAIKTRDLIKTFYGEYDGSQGSVVVRRNMEIKINSVDNMGNLYGIATISPSYKAPAKYGINCSYKFKGKVDLTNGRLYDVQGYQWIKKVDNFDFVELNGYYDINKNKIIGKSENGIWSLPRSYNCKQTLSVNKSVKKTVVIKKQSLKKKAVIKKIGAKAKTKITYAVTSGNKKYVSVSKKGVITIKKNAKKGTYKITVTANRTAKYRKATKVITIKVK